MLGNLNFPPIGFIKYFTLFQKHLKIFRFNCHLCYKESIKMGFPTKKRLYRHMKFAHHVDPAAEDNEANHDLIYNPPPLPPRDPDEPEKKSRRGRIKGAKNRLKLDPDTGQLVRTLVKKPRSKSTKSSTPRKRKKIEENNVAILLNEHAAQSLWWSGTFQLSSQIN